MLTIAGWSRRCAQLSSAQLSSAELTIPIAQCDTVPTRRPWTSGAGGLFQCWCSPRAPSLTNWESPHSPA